MSNLRRSNDRVTVPDGERDGVKVETFTVPPHAIENLRLAMTGRGMRPGNYVRLLIDGELWMSDTDAEYNDHRPAISRLAYRDTRRVLIHGLGLGMVVKAALDQPHVEHVDVVEIDPRVVALVGPHYLSDPRVTIHTGDAFELKWPNGIGWDVVWHDIWRDLAWDKNLPEQDRLQKRFRGRARWQGSWGREVLLRRRRDDRAGRWSR